MEWINTGITAVLTILLFIVARKLQVKDTQQTEMRHYFSDLEKAILDVKSEIQTVKAEARIEQQALKDAVMYLKEMYIKLEKWLLTLDRQVQNNDKQLGKLQASHEQNHNQKL